MLIFNILDLFHNFSTQRYEIENSCPNHKNESPINKSYE